MPRTFYTLTYLLYLRYLIFINVDDLVSAFTVLLLLVCLAASFIGLGGWVGKLIK